MIADIFDLCGTSETGFFPIRQHSLKQMRVLRFLRRSVNQARIRRRVLRFELLDRFEVSRVSHDFGKLLQLLQLVQLCFGLLLLNDSSAHDNSSLFWLKSKRTLEQNIDNDKVHTFRRESKDVEASELRQTDADTPEGALLVRREPIAARTKLFPSS